MDTLTQKRWMTAEDVAAYLGFSTSKIYKLVEKRSIPHVHVDGKQTLRFDVREIDEWMSAQTTRPRRKIQSPPLPVDKTTLSKVQYIV